MPYFFSSTPEYIFYTVLDNSNLGLDQTYTFSSHVISKNISYPALQCHSFQILGQSLLTQVERLYSRGEPKFGLAVFFPKKWLGRKWQPDLECTETGRLRWGRELWELIWYSIEYVNQNYFSIGMDSIINSEHNHPPPIAIPVVVFEVNIYFPSKLIILKFRLGYVLCWNGNDCTCTVYWSGLNLSNKAISNETCYEKQNETYNKQHKTSNL